MEQDTSEHESRLPAHFRGWFLALVIVGWVSGVLLVGLRILVPGLALLLATAALLALVDARGLFTLHDRLPWERTGIGGRALLVALVLIALPLVVTIYLIVAVRRFRIGRRLRAARPLSGPVSAPPASGDSKPSLPTSSKGVAMRPLATSLPPLEALSPRGEPLYAETDLTPVPPPPVPVTRRRRPVLLAGCLASSIAILLLSCGVLVFAAPGRFFTAAGAPATARRAKTSRTGDPAPAASVSPPSVMPRATATPTSTPTTAATPTATSTPPPTATASPTPPTTPAPIATAGTTPTPTPTTAPGPLVPTATPSPTPVPTAQPTPAPRSRHRHRHRRTRRHSSGSTAANPSLAANTASALTFGCAQTAADGPPPICFPAPAGQPVHVEIQYRCANAAGASGAITRSIPAASDGALQWTWTPPSTCFDGVAFVVLRADTDEGVVEARGTVPFGWGSALPAAPTPEVSQ